MEVTFAFALAVMIGSTATVASAQSAGDAPAPSAKTKKSKALTVSPKTLKFGDLPPLTASASKTVTIHNPNSTAINVNSIESGNSDFVPSKNCVGILGAEGDCNVSIVFAASSDGKKSARLTIVNGASKKSLRVKMTGKGVGTPVPSRTPSATPTASATATSTSSMTATASRTATGTATGGTPTATATSSVTATASRTATATASGGTPTATETSSVTGTPNQTATATATGGTPTMTSTASPSATPTVVPGTPQISSLGSTSLPPFALLTINGSFDPNSAVSVKFFDAAGFSIGVSPVQLTRSSLTVGVPPYFDPSTELPPGSGAAAIFVTNLVSNSVTVYALSSSSSNVFPVATIVGTSTGLDSPVGIAVDSSGNIYVANCGIDCASTGGADSVTVYPPGSNGNVSPIATITGSNTGLNTLQGIALDSNRNIYVTNAFGGALNNGSITVYAAGTNGNVSPLATITDPNFSDIGDVELDSGGNIYVTDYGANAIDNFPAGSKGEVAANTIISGQFNSLCASAGTPFSCCTGSGTGTCSDQTMLDFPVGIALDNSGNIYVGNCGFDCGGISDAGSLTVYPAGSSGNVSPSATVSGAATGVNGPGGVALDSSGNIYVANCGSNCGSTGSGSITVYSPGSKGNVPPIATIIGSNTGLNSPRGIAIGPSVQAAQTVNVQVVENSGASQSNVVAGFQIQSLPPAPPALTPGTVTVGYLLGVAQSTAALSTLPALTADPNLAGLVASAENQADFVYQLEAVAQAAVDDPSTVLTVEDGAGNQFTVTSADLTLSDRMIAGMLTVLASQTTTSETSQHKSRSVIQVSSSSNCYAAAAQQFLNDAYQTNPPVPGPYDQLAFDYNKFDMQFYSCGPNDPTDTYTNLLVLGGASLVVLGVAADVPVAIGAWALINYPTLTEFVTGMTFNLSEGVTKTGSTDIGLLELVKSGSEVGVETGLMTPIGFGDIAGGTAVYEIWESRDEIQSVDDDAGDLEDWASVQGGGVVTCPPTENQCGVSCSDISSDPLNCGGCGNQCPYGYECQSSSCVVPSPKDIDPCVPAGGYDADTLLQHAFCPVGNSGDYYCADLLSDLSNCGTCGSICTGVSCDIGSCVCGSGQTGCPESGILMGTTYQGILCTDLATDSYNCGSCGNVCQACNDPNACSDGSSCCLGSACCTIGGVQSGCADLDNDPMNCGACGNVCGAGEACCQGFCSDLFSDPTDCGACGNSCFLLGDSICASGTCVED